ncbi:peptidoglycan-binding domain-containing protein [Actinomycetospora termitidis]|uniref:Peptidoglycan-binding domain-containing protein n=1 Tax=Actinomycetospora termitidis TaxID=3053470 RepID=A0ABT7MFE3_9PSEU|nr:peptidoglycan-binding domain-containing protein [Actinomycetospora sp. Odt1-22]MDL5159390.1 peptidoglycan-binding domain-containing protein [Actinomycetospora sp. Odt1-22]
MNARWPGRDKTSDGTIGDAAHATRNSDHNPWVVVAGQGVVRADDIDVDGIDPGWYAEKLRQMGAAGDPRLTGGGYVIYNRRITAPDFSGWKAYSGSNPHDHHVHTSYSRDVAGFDSDAAWNFGAPLAPAPAAPATSGVGVLRRGSKGPEVAAWQRFLRRSYSRFGSLVDDGDYGPATEAFVRKVQAFRGITADGISGPATFRATNYR